MKKQFSCLLMIIFMFSSLYSRVEPVKQESSLAQALRVQKEKMQKIRSEKSPFLEPDFEKRMQTQQTQKHAELKKEAAAPGRKLVKTKKGLKRVFSISDQINGFYSMINNPREIEIIGADNFVNNLRQIVLYLGGRPPENSPQKIKYLWREMISLLKLAIQNINANKITVLEPKQKELEDLLKILEKDYSLADHFTNLKLYLDGAKEVPDTALFMELVELLTNEAIGLKKKGQLSMMEGMVKDVLNNILTLRNLFSDADRTKIHALLEKLEITEIVPEEKEEVSAVVKTMADKKVEEVEEVGKGYPDPAYAQKFALVEQLIAKGYQGDAKLDTKEIQALIDALRFLTDNMVMATPDQREVLYSSASFLAGLEKTTEATARQKRDLRDLARRAKEPITFIVRINYLSGKVEEIKDVDSNSIYRFIKDIVKLTEEFVDAKIKGEKPEGEDALIKLLENILNDPTFVIYKQFIQSWINKIKDAKPEVKKEEVKPDVVAAQPVVLQPQPAAASVMSRHTVPTVAPVAKRKTTVIRYKKEFERGK